MKALLNQSTATQHYTCSERQTYTPRLDPTEATYMILKEAAPPGRGRHPSGARSASARGGTWQWDAAGTRGEDEPEQRTRARDLMTQCLHAEPAAWPRHSAVAAWRTGLGLNFCSSRPGNWTHAKAVASFSSPSPLFCVLSCMTLSLRIIHVKRLW